MNRKNDDDDDNDGDGLQSHERRNHPWSGESTWL